VRHIFFALIFPSLCEFRSCGQPQDWSWRTRIAPFVFEKTQSLY